MKQVIFLLFTLALTSSSFAQNDDIVIRGTTKVNKKLAPKVVIDSLNKTFPDAKAIAYYKTPKDAAKNGWIVTEDNELGPDDDIEFYTISFKRNDMQYYGLYKANGQLVSSKLVQKVNKLPEPVVASLRQLGSTYPGYKVLSRTYYKNTNHSSNKEHYEIVAEKGRDKKRLFYSMDGKLVNVKG